MLKKFVKKQFTKIKVSKRKHNYILFQIILEIILPSDVKISHVNAIKHPITHKQNLLKGKE